MPRPCKFDPAVAAAIVQAIAGGASLEAASRTAGVPRTTVTGIRVDREGLAAKIAEAKERAKKSPAPARKAAPSPARASADPVRSAQPEIIAWVKANRARLAERSARASKAGQISSSPAPAPERAENAAGVEAPQLMCTWSANRAAAVLLVNLLGAILDRMRDELRRERESVL